jgi:hypothetical protein
MSLAQTGSDSVEPKVEGEAAEPQPPTAGFAGANSMPAWKDTVLHGAHRSCCF